VYTYTFAHSFYRWIGDPSWVYELSVASHRTQSLWPICETVLWLSRYINREAFILLVLHVLFYLKKYWLL
jgi:hypothetical protein